MTITKKLFVYATVLNNAEWIKDCIVSVERIKPEWIMITNASSTDGTTQILEKMSAKYKNILITHLIYNVASNEDLVMYIDCDNVYSDYSIDYIRAKSKVVKDMESYIFGLMTIKTSKLAEWKDLNYSEDWERFAHLKSLGVHIKDYIRENDTAKWTIQQRQGVGMFEREKYYNRSKLSIFNSIIQSHKGLAYKNRAGDAKHFTSKVANIIAHVLAYPYYSYDAKLNNKEFCQSKE